MLTAQSTPSQAWQATLAPFDALTAAAGNKADDVLGLKSETKEYGDALAMSGDGRLLLCGHSRYGLPDQPNCGAVDVFLRDDSVPWPRFVFKKRLIPDQVLRARPDSAPWAYHYFGRSLALNADGTLLAIGAYGSEGYGAARDSSSNHYGAVYVFEFERSTLRTRLRSIIGKGYQGARDCDVPLDREDYFGQSVLLDGSEIYVGSHHASGYLNDRPLSGQVFRFRLTPRATQLIGVMGAGFGGPGDVDIEVDSNEYFGHSLALAEGRLFVGAYGHKGGGARADEKRGSVYAAPRPAPAGGSLRPCLVGPNAGDKLGTALSYARGAGILYVTAVGDFSSECLYSYRVSEGGDLKAGPTVALDHAEPGWKRPQRMDRLYGSAVATNDSGDVVAISDTAWPSFYDNRQGKVMILGKL